MVIDSSQVDSIVVQISSTDADTWRERVPATTYKEGQVLFYKGHYPYGVFVVYDGKLRLSPDENSRASGLEVDSQKIVGFSSLIEQSTYPLTAVVTQELSASFVEKTLIFEWISQNDALIPPEFRKLPSS